MAIAMILKFSGPGRHALFFFPSGPSSSLPPLTTYTRLPFLYLPLRPPPPGGVQHVQSAVHIMHHGLVVKKRGTQKRKLSRKT